MAGLNAKRLVNEPTAPALAYGLQDRDGESQFLVFDLGGGTFDVTVLEHFDGEMQVKASSGDAFLGGEDFSEALAKAMAETAGLMWPKLSPEDQAQIRFQADGAKRRLGPDEAHGVTLRIGGEEHSVTVTRALFEEAAPPLLKRIYRPIERCFYDSGEGIDDLDRVILVGGATRMPMIRSLVAKQFRILPEMTIDPDHAVALGASVQAGLVAQDKALDDVVMTNVTPFSVGIDTGSKMSDGTVLGGFFAPIIERNTPLPASREREFGTMHDRQDNLSVDIYQGEAPKCEDNVHIGRFSVKVPKGPAGKESIAIRATYDSSGLIQVEGRSLSTGKTAGTVIRDNVTDLSDADIAKRLKAMEKLKLHPREDEVNTAVLARIRRLFEMASGDDRHALSNLLMRFEAALARQDNTEIAKERGEITEVLDRLDDFYVS